MIQSLKLNMSDTRSAIMLPELFTLYIIQNTQARKGAHKIFRDYCCNNLK